MKTKNIILIGILLIGVYIAVSMITGIYNYEKNYAIYSHDLLMNRSMTDYPYIENSDDKIRVDYCIGNFNDTISILTIDNHHRLILSQISGFNNVLSDTIKTFEIDNFESITWPVMMDNKYGIESLHFASQLDTFLTANKLGLIIEAQSKLIDYKRETDFQYFKLNSRGIALTEDGESIKLKLHLDKDAKEMEVLFSKINDGFQLAVLYPIDTQMTKSIFDYIKN